MIVLSYQPVSYREFKKVIKCGLEFGADILEIRGEKINHKELIKILNSPLFSRFQYAKDLAGKSNLKEVLEIWLNYFRAILLEKCSSSNIEHLAKIEKILQKIQRTIFLVSTTNVNPRLALEILMLEL